jgi:uncharacterized protein YukE
MNMNEFNPDEQADVELIKSVLSECLEPIIAVVQQMLDKIGMMDEEIDSLSKLVNEELIGGITNLYKSKERMSGISSMSEKYGELMGPYKDFYSEMTDGSDIYEKLYDELEEFKSTAETADDASVDAKVQELANMLKSKFEKVSGMGKKDEPVAVEVEVEKSEPEPNPQEEMLAKIRRMKAKSGDVKF